MQMPATMPTVPRLAFFRPTFNSGLAQQGFFDFLPIPIPGGRAVQCAACCAGKAGFAACVARCVATGQACDGGIDNCTPC